MQVKLTALIKMTQTKMIVKLKSIRKHSQFKKLSQIIPPSLSMNFFHTHVPLAANTIQKH